ncbi:MAG: hypothetical protein LBT43_03865 [Prevotella sp.]|jgi:hypothetical protein|nr:hypothetical protein [Prevotella sp.]
MKRFRTLLFPLLSIILFSCSDDNDNFKFSPESLRQTSWQGTLTESYNGGETIKKSDIGFIFYTTSEGQYDIKYKDAEPERTQFSYSIDDKMLLIEPNIELKGYWLLIEKNKDQLILEQSSGGEYSYKATLTLDRKH